MKDSSPKKGRTPVLMVSLGLLALAFSLAWIDRESMSRRNPPVASVKQNTIEPRLLTPEEKLNHSVLADAILSIVQSYYVDKERVDDHALVQIIADTINQNSDATAVARTDRFVLKYRGQQVSIAMDPSSGYQAMLDLFTSVAGAVDAYGIEIADSDGASKQTLPSVKLFNHVLGTLDAHSALLSPEAYRELRQGTEGSFGGLGVLVGIRDKLLTVIKPLPRSPAKRAGIQRQDRILGIDGVKTYGFTLDDLVEYMRGDPGTLVNLSLLREGDQAPIEMALRREIIHVDSVTSKDLVEKDSYILQLTIESFSSRTSREVLSAIKKFRIRHGGRLDGLVLDLRANPGGLLDQAVQVVDLFIPKGVIVSTKGRREEVESAGSGFDELGFPMVTLIDGDSASASEIVAGALQDHGRSVILGQPSFGKGSVQTIFEIPGERALKLTIARYYTPAGRSIQNIGIVPDLWLQPVFRSAENSNVLGMFRYKNERFLRNHLLVSEQQDQVRWPSLKSYYLTDPFDQDERLPADDVELSAALKIIKQVNKHYPRLTPANARATHWLALAAPSLEQEFQTSQREVDQYLQGEFGVSWQGKKQGRLGPKISLVAKTMNVVPGQSIPVRWQLTNPYDHSLHKVSIFLRSEIPGFETKEMLVGSIDSHSTKAGTIELDVPSYWTESVVKVRVGTAVDAWPVDSAADLILNVGHRDMAALTATSHLADEKGGVLVGTLEDSETASLVVDIENNGFADARDLRVSLINLAGKQIDIDSDSIAIDALSVGGVTSVRFPVRAGAALHSPELGLGLYVESDDLKNPYTRRLTIRGAPAEKLGKLMGH